MAKVPKNAILKHMVGMPSKGAIMAAGGDDTPAVIHDQEGNPIAPAALKEGEIVFSIPAIVGAGNGDYDEGSRFLLELHDQLKEVGEHFLSQQGLGALEQ